MILSASVKTLQGILGGALLATVCSCAPAQESQHVEPPSIETKVEEQRDILPLVREFFLTHYEKKDDTNIVKELQKVLSPKSIRTLQQKKIPAELIKKFNKKGYTWNNAIGFARTHQTEHSVRLLDDRKIDVKLMTVTDIKIPSYFQYWAEKQKFGVVDAYIDNTGLVYYHPARSKRVLQNLFQGFKKYRNILEKSIESPALLKGMSDNVQKQKKVAEKSLEILVQRLLTRFSAPVVKKKLDYVSLLVESAVVLNFPDPTKEVKKILQSPEIRKVLEDALTSQELFEAIKYYSLAKQHYVQVSRALRFRGEKNVFRACGTAEQYFQQVEKDWLHNTCVYHASMIYDTHNLNVPVPQNKRVHVQIRAWLQKIANSKRPHTVLGNLTRNISAVPNSRFADLGSRIHTSFFEHVKKNPRKYTTIRSSSDYDYLNSLALSKPEDIQALAADVFKGVYGNRHFGEWLKEQKQKEMIKEDPNAL